MFVWRCAFLTAAIMSTASCFPVGPAAADDATITCDPVNDKGWHLVRAREVDAQEDTAPHPGSVAGQWIVERTTTTIPYCHYFNSLGVYSMRSYALAPEVKQEEVSVCEPFESGSHAVAPYAGPCPPK